ncbi:MAG TPA: hypothetical protein VNU19_17300 [Candidatus Acidoferrum sp.]|nr:hypothetical protein [Candidatus Acidoferrum sp.]
MTTTIHSGGVDSGVGRTTQTWDLWIPDVASRGISFARGVMDSCEIVLVHSAPSMLRVEVRDENAVQVAFGDNLGRIAESPMTQLTVKGGSVSRHDIWPTEVDIGRPVILPGGEVGILKAWWNASDHGEWRWSVEFYNRV